MRVRFGNLVVSKPNTAVEDGEREDVVEEGFTLTMSFRGVENVLEHFFEELVMRFLIKRCVE